MQKLIITSLIFIISQTAFAFNSNAKYAVLMDYDTKTILFEKEAYTRMAPSSMSKMMTAYIAFENLQSGQVKLDELFPISEKAWRMGGTRMFIPLNSHVSFENLLKGLIIQSGNDAAVAIAEILMGNEEEFVEKMNETAKRLGMNRTNFTNASGWPDENNYSCAYDLAILGAKTIEDFPQYYHYYAQKEFVYNDIKQGNRNGLLYRNIGADGLKTGHADEAGYGVTASVKRQDRRLIAVVNGLKSNKERTIEAEALLNYGLMNFTNVKILDKNHPIEKIKVSNGIVKELNLISPSTIIMTIPKSEAKHLKIRINYHSPIIAPVDIMQKLGEIEVETANMGKKTYPLFSSSDVNKAGFIQRIEENFKSLFD
jgi:serine-type D-Ala-D-Ala carboxypeptidase (penicillin-binding protein 5/6)